MTDPILIVSLSGCGKSTAFRAYAERVKKKLIIHNCSQEDPPEVCGASVPVHATKTTERYVPDTWLQACTQPCILLFEEITNCTPDQQTAMLAASDLSREIAGHKLHPDTEVFLICNPPEFAGGAARPVNAQLLARVRVVNIGAEHAIDFMRGGKGLEFNYPVEEPVDPDLMVVVVGNWLAENSDYALANADIVRRAVQECKPYPNPRSWERAARGEGNIDLWREYVGASAATAFKKYWEGFRLPATADILAGNDYVHVARRDWAQAVAHVLSRNCPVKADARQLGCVEDFFLWAADNKLVGAVANELRQLIGRIGPARAAIHMTRIGEHYDDVINFQRP